MKIEPIHRTSMWKFRLSAATMTLIPAAVGINYVAKALAEGIKSPNKARDGMVWKIPAICKTQSANFS